MRLKLIFAAFCMVIAFAFGSYRQLHAQDAGPPAATVVTVVPAATAPHATPSPIPTIAPQPAAAPTTTSSIGSDTSFALKNLKAPWWALCALGLLILLKIVQAEESKLAKWKPWFASPQAAHAITVGLTGAAALVGLLLTKSLGWESAAQMVLGGFGISTLHVLG